MRLGWRHAIAGALGIVLICLAGVGLAGGQTAPAAKQTTPVKKPAAAGTAAKTAAPAEKPLLAGDFFKNVQVLKDIPVDQFMDTMGFFAASLSLNCIDCHVEESGGNWAHYADDTQLKITTRKMVLMVNALNKANFGGSRSVTCWTCHRGGQQPTVIPSLLEQYSPPPPDDPNEYQVHETARDAPTADQIFAKYIEALGGAQKLAALTSFVGKGTYEGFDTEHEKSPFEVYAKSPNLRTTVQHFRMGEGVHTFDGHNAWIAAPDKPLPLMELTGGQLDGAKLDAMVAFPMQLKAAFPAWKVGATAIGDTQDVWVLQGSAPGRSTVKLYFDKKSNLLVRVVRYETTVVGTNPIQLDYSNYKAVAGVKMPFAWTLTWTDGQDIIELTDVQPNAAIEASRFIKPPPAEILAGSGAHAPGQ
jgi:photosynthetic reaction center cytochrome c subunit